MADFIHPDATGLELHALPFASYANDAARVAATPAATEVNKTALQLDTGELWRLVSISPTVWAPHIRAATTAGAALGATALQPAGNLTGTVNSTSAAAISSAVASVAAILALGVGILHQDGAGNISSSKITTADVHATAGITATQLSAGVQTSLGKADTALQPATAISVTGITVSTLGAGIGHYSSGGVLTSSAIVSADISASAAITATQLSAAVQTSLGKADTALQPTTAIAVTSIALGTTPATTGLIRIPHAQKIIGRNQANNADLDLFDFGTAANNRLSIGNTVGDTYTNTATNMLMQVASATKVQLSATILYLYGPTISMINNAVNPRFDVQAVATASATGASMIYTAQDMSGTTNVVAGHAILRGSACTAVSGIKQAGDGIVQAGLSTAGGTPTNGSARMKDAAGNTIVQAFDSKLAFFGGTTIAQPADLGAPTGWADATAQAWAAALRTNILRPTTGLGLTA